MIAPELDLTIDEDQVVQALDAVFVERKGYAIEEDFIAQETAAEFNARMGRLIFRIPDDRRLRGNGSRIPEYVRPRNGWEALLVGKGLGHNVIGWQLEQITRDYGRRNGIEELANWTHNKTVINRMPGSDRRPAVIQGHHDPDYLSGVLYSLGMADADIGINRGPFRPFPAGGLAVFAGYDLAKKMDIVQPWHTLVTKHMRHSPVFAHDTRPPLKLANMTATLGRTASSFRQKIYEELEGLLPA